MRINQLLIINDIANSKSITRSSERLYISTSNISQAISSLEEELNIKIFTRSRAGLIPTIPGKEIINKSTEIMEKIEELTQIAIQHSDNQISNLAISSEWSIASDVTSQIINVTNRYENFNITVNEGGTSQVRNEVLSKISDFGIISVPRSYKESNKYLTNTYLFESPMVALVGKNSELALKETLTLSDIVNHPIASLESIQQNHPEVSEYLEKQGKILSFSTTSPNIRNLLVSQKNAVGFDSEFSVSKNPYIQNGDIIVKRIVSEIAIPKRAFYLIKLKQINLSGAAQEFFDELQNHYTNDIKN